jgi:hypothetical protein
VSSARALWYRIGQLAGAALASAVLWVGVGFAGCHFKIGGAQVADTLTCTDERLNAIGWWIVALPLILLAVALALGPGFRPRVRGRVTVAAALVLGAATVVGTPLEAKPQIVQVGPAPAPFVVELDPRGGASRAELCLPRGGCLDVPKDGSDRFEADLAVDPAPGRGFVRARLRLCRLLVHCVTRTYEIRITRGGA